MPLGTKETDEFGEGDYNWSFVSTHLNTNMKLIRRSECITGNIRSEIYSFNCLHCFHLVALSWWYSNNAAYLHHGWFSCLKLLVNYSFAENSTSLISTLLCVVLCMEGMWTFECVATKWHAASFTTDSWSVCSRIWSSWRQLHTKCYHWFTQRSF